MKTIRVFASGVRLRDVYPYATRFQVVKWHIARFVRKLVIAVVLLAVLASLLYGAYEAGRQFNPVTVSAKEFVQVPVSLPSPVMDKIAKCESSNMHTRDGQVLVKSNTNGSVDIGLFQINSVWDKQATKLGYDLTKEADNRSFAFWLYANYGTEPWYSSKNCWR